jgi:TolB-like protein/DNA-binding winged helix-turn-helix (wHTH) protein/tetratricopeptide (TPR) repeat protein
MSTPNPYQSAVRFGVYELDLRAGIVSKGGVRIRCQEQPLQVLAALLERPGELVTREELRRRVWPQDTFVDFDHALNTAIKKIRAALNDDADAPRYVETVPRRGYRFIGTLETSSVLPPSAETATLALPQRAESPEGGFRLPSWLLALGAASVLTTAALFYFNAHRAKASVGAAPSRVMVAVLPFQNMTGDSNQESFGDGMTEETITRLCRLNSPRIGVIARTSAMKYKNARKGVDEIGRELHADYVLEGSIRREGPRVRVSAQLMHAPDQTARWAREFDFTSSETLNIESEVAGEIANRINIILGDSAAPRAPFFEDEHDPHLRDLAETAIHTPEGLNLLLAAFEQATKDDLNCSVPYAGLARVYERGAYLGFLQPRLAFAKAREAVQHALQIDPSLPEAHFYLADALLTIDYDWKGAQAEIEKALALNANDPLAHEWNGMFLSAQGKMPEAIQEMSRAVELDPLNAERRSYLGVLLIEAGRHAEAEKQLTAALQIDPAFETAHFILQRLYEKEGRHSEAIAEWSSIFALHGQREIAVELKNVFEKSGFDAARKLAMTEQLSYLTKLNKTRYVSLSAFASLYAQLGNKEQALLWLEKAYEVRDVRLPYLAFKDNPSFATLKDEPRFQAVVRKVRSPQ